MKSYYANMLHTDTFTPKGLPRKVRVYKADEVDSEVGRLERQIKRLEEYIEAERYIQRQSDEENKCV